MNGRPKLEEQYKKDNDVINFVVYNSTTCVGDDEVLQHKILGTTETVHITLHLGDSINFRVKRSKTALELAVRNGLIGYFPSAKVKQFKARKIFPQRSP